jgi:HNH endonuclease
MHGISVCETCKKEYKWRRKNSGNPPRFCSFECRKWDRCKGRKKNSELTGEENLSRIKKYFDKYAVKQEECWDWKGIIDSTGYTVLGIRPHIKGHRASWIIHKGPIPIGMNVCHSCDNRKCTNPEHLWIGSQKENIQDKIKKGRANTPKGSDLKQAKLKEEDVEYIKILLIEGLTCGDIARYYEVSRKIISRIKNGETWKHVN